MSFLGGIFDSPKVPNAPDYSPMISAYNGIAASSAAHGNDALTWAQQQVANNKDLTDQVNNGLLDTQQRFGDAASGKLDSSGRLLSTGDQGLLDTRAKYSDTAKKAADMGAAGAGAAQATEAARQASTRELESYGLNPGDVRYAGLDSAARLQSAATRIGAENIAGRTDDALADQANKDIVAQGNVESGQANTNAGTSGAAGTGAVNTGLATTTSGYQGLGTGLQWTGADTNALGGAVNAQNTGFSNTLESDKVANSSSTGLGSLLGAGASMLGKGGALASGGALSFLAEGGAVPTDQPGGAIPVDASPSGGAVTDDVPAAGPGGAIRLNGGEFVIPKDVVSWEGEKALQNLILKARKAKEEATAKPRVQAPGGPDPASPAFQPRPQPSAGAVPV